MHVVFFSQGNNHRSVKTSATPDLLKYFLLIKDSYSHLLISSKRLPNGRFLLKKKPLQKNPKSCVARKER